YFQISLNHGGVLGPTFSIPGKGSVQLGGIADIDGDGDKDIVAGACVFFARGPIVAPPCPPTGIYGGTTASITDLRDDLCDLDRDGDPDFAFGREGKGVNDGSGALAWLPNPLPLPANTQAGTWTFRGDFDGDGAPDLVVPLFQLDFTFAHMRLLRNN